MAKRQLNRRQTWRIQKIQDERSARAAKREARAVEELEGGDLGPEQTGLVIAHFGVTVEVESDEGVRHRCHLRANLPALVTGDRVVWRAGNQDNGVIVAQLPRTSELCRPNNHGQLKPVAANVEQILIVIAPEPHAHANLIDRYLVAAEHAGIKPLLLLNKVDLLNDENSPRLHSMLDTYRGLGYQVLEVSAHHGDAMEQLYAALDGHISVFVGQSGVGKSSLVNTLLPGEDTRVGDLSQATGKGTHTTTTARLFHFPSGGDLIDSPGIREFALSHIDRHAVEDGFVEFRDLLGRCRFRDCKHEQEPGCALLKALEDGTVSPLRINSYRHILASLPEKEY
ncbi:small ribosomal subunit biogenesis GTPase RsgA [Atopomonas sediminilitoris]|uniref:small ribosomal subunit biogenesis GTPase RsgA n=1 Tax=Atopomonas sediminilitoris TaxID=2919919 RepID=UPI001F4E4BB2|nr:small ribosomal subunit biogenesis GTPase RsgA [Atopomonas sediminilitoris]MCJ8170255.1 small ribosomal subunit biogenesis GTPase RsgA [Atopomonas sediminilitoris]